LSASSLSEAAAAQLAPHSVVRRCTRCRRLKPTDVFAVGSRGFSRTCTSCQTLSRDRICAMRAALCLDSVAPAAPTTLELPPIPLQVHNESVCGIKKNSHLAEVLRQAALIIWDECPLQNKQCFEAVDLTLQDIRSYTTIFGGTPTMFGGDFAQILPVVVGGDRANVVKACLQTSYIWPHLRVRRFDENMRVHGLDKIKPSVRGVVAESFLQRASQ